MKQTSMKKGTKWNEREYWHLTILERIASVGRDFDEVHYYRSILACYILTIDAMSRD